MLLQYFVTKSHVQFGSMEPEARAAMQPYIPENNLAKLPIKGKAKDYSKGEPSQLRMQMRTTESHGLITIDTLTPDIVKQLPTIMNEVSLLISDYTDDPATKNEMVAKSPAQLYDAFLKGESAVYVAFDPSEGRYVPIGHAAVWGLLPKQVEQEYKIQIYEFGSWIVHRDFWHNKEVETFGQHQIVEDEFIGEAVASELMTKLQEKNHPPNRDSDGRDDIHYEVLATVKRENALNGLKRVGFNTDSFHEHKLLTAATCSCSSEHHGNGPVCEHRRSAPNGEVAVLRGSGAMGYDFQEEHLPDGHAAAPRIPCTLVTNTLLEDRDIVTSVLLDQYINKSDSIMRGAVGRVSPDLAKKIFFEAVDSSTILQPHHMTMLEGLMNLLGVSYQ